MFGRSAEATASRRSPESITVGVCVIHGASETAVGIRLAVAVIVQSVAEFGRALTGTAQNPSVANRDACTPAGRKYTGTAIGVLVRHAVTIVVAVVAQFGGARFDKAGRVIAVAALVDRPFANLAQTRRQSTTESIAIHI
jgi:hypothetical protein